MSELELQNDDLRLIIDGSEGRWDYLGPPAGPNLLTGEVRPPGLDIQIGHREWLREGSPPRLQRHRRSSDQLLLEWSIGPALLEETLTLGPGGLKRQVSIRNLTDTELQITGLRLELIGARISSPEDCLFEAPASAVRPRIPLALARQQGRKGPFDRAFAPSAYLRWGRAVDDSPDVTPGLLALHNPRTALSLLLWYYSEVEAADPQVCGRGTDLVLGHELHLAGWLGPESRLKGGTQHLWLHSGTWKDALQSLQEKYREVGILPPLYGEPPEWVKSAALYEVHPGLFGGFSGLIDQLPRIRGMGFNVLYLLPVMTYDNRSGKAWDENWLGAGSPYAMMDFETFEPTLGTEAEFRELVRAAHDLGFRVLMDFVAQGCAVDSHYLTDHPEWFCRDERGRFVSSHGWIDTYSFDWANPAFQSYMQAWAMRFVEEYDIDGFRVDAPHGKEPNWSRDIPYHASQTNLGLVPLLEDLQQGLKTRKPEGALLCELFGPLFVKSHDFQCDYHPLINLYAFAKGDLSAHEIGLWLQDYWLTVPSDSKRVAFTETHDTRANYESYALRGSALERSLFAVLVMAGFLPMIWTGQESGWEGYYQQILSLRQGSSTLLQGTRHFNRIQCDRTECLSILIQDVNLPVMWGVVSLYPERTPLRFSFDEGVLPEEGEEIRLFDELGGAFWDEYGHTKWPSEDFREISLSLVPFTPYFFRLERIRDGGS